MDKKYLSVAEGAKFLGVSVSSLRLWVRQGRLRAVRVGSRVLLDREYLEARASTGRLLEPGGDARPVPGTA